MVAEAISGMLVCRVQSGLLRLGTTLKCRTMMQQMTQMMSQQTAATQQATPTPTQSRGTDAAAKAVLSSGPLNAAQTPRQSRTCS